MPPNGPSEGFAEAMYTHARQFPHLAGMDDSQIRALMRRGMARRPGLIRLMRLRNRAIMLAMVVGTVVLTQSTRIGLGPTLVIVGALGTAVILLWNLIWVNTTVFRVTRDEVTRDSGQRESAESADHATEDVAQVGAEDVDVGPRRGRWQFTLRQLLLAVAVVAILLSLYQWTMTVKVGSVPPDARVADHYFGFIAPESFLGPLAEKELRPRNIARVSERFFANGLTLSASLYLVEDGSASQINEISVGQSSSRLGDWFGEHLQITFALGDLETPDGRVTMLGSTGQTTGGGSGSPFLHNVQPVAWVLVPGRVTRGEPRVVYAEGDQPPTVEFGMSVEEFARANAGSYLVVTMALE